MRLSRSCDSPGTGWDRVRSSSRSVRRTAPGPARPAPPAAWSPHRRRRPARHRQRIWTSMPLLRPLISGARIPPPCTTQSRARESRGSRNARKLWSRRRISPDGSNPEQARAASMPAAGGWASSVRQQLRRRWRRCCGHRTRATTHRQGSDLPRPIRRRRVTTATVARIWCPNPRSAPRRQAAVAIRPGRRGHDPSAGATRPRSGTARRSPLPATARRPRQPTRPPTTPLRAPAATFPAPARPVRRCRTSARPARAPAKRAPWARVTTCRAQAHQPEAHQPEAHQARAGLPRLALSRHRHRVGVHRAVLGAIGR